MTSKIGIEQSKKLVSVFAKSLNVVGNAFEDGKIDWKDLDEILPLGEALLPLKDVEYSAAIKEFKDYDSDERSAMLLAFNEEFDITQDQIEVVAEKAIGLINRQVSVVMDGMSLWSELRKLTKD